jgi:hydrogenase maturation protease
MQQQKAERTLVLGVGNLLMGDEGVGIHAVRELMERPLPPHVDIVDGGTAGLELLHLIEGYSRVVIIDAVEAGEEPGAILRFTPEDLTPQEGDFAISLHQTEVLEVFSLAAYLGRDLPPIVIYGVQPQAMDWSTELTPIVQASLPRLLAALQRELSMGRE